VSVIRLLEANGITLRRQPLTREQAERAVDLYQAGHSLTTIEKIVDLSRESIRRALIEAGVKMRPRGSSKSQGREEATSL
jgi:DNA invertase Pin-like site-specific DNA recombinase